MATPSNNNYAPPRSVVADVQEAGSDKATRLSRLGAAFIDGLIFSIPFAPSYVVAFNTIAHQGRITAVAAWMAMAATGALFYLGVMAELVILSVVAFLVYKNSQTIGKKIFGIKVVRSDGSRATFGRIFWLRNFVNTLLTMIPLLGGLYALVDILMIFGDARRCCHDHIADTIVIRA